MKNCLSFVVLVSLMFLSACGSQKSVELFDGETLNGWQNLGGGNFYVENGTIVGKAAPLKPNSFLATETMYDDFELNIEFKIDSLLNSGIQIRSNIYDKETTTERWGGRFKEDGSKDLQNKIWEAGRFWGYQVEIDPTQPGWTGALYEEGGRGYLHTPGEGEDAARAFKPNEWNHFRIVAQGDQLQTWLNGVPVVDMVDGLTSTGYIGLQLHRIGKKTEKIGKTIEWRNIVIKEL